MIMAGLVLSQTERVAQLNPLARHDKQGSPLLPVPAKQKPDALVQCGPAGLVSQKSQEVWTEGGHLGPCLEAPKEEGM